MSEYDKMIAELEDEFPKFRLIEKKDSFMMKAIDIFLKVITFWKMKSFMTKFTTTVGYLVYTPSGWGKMDKVGILDHERDHMRRMRKVGRIWFTISYLAVWFPVGLAYYRKEYEQSAYEITMRRVAKRFGIETIEGDAYKNHMIKRFTGPKYVWTWPFRKDMEKWYDGAVKKIRLEMGLPPKDKAA